MTERSALKVPIEISGRHIHLARTDVEALFGAGAKLQAAKIISQPGQYVASERVTVEGPKGAIKNVAVIGPEREMTQLEISRTDSFTLGVTASCVLSGVPTVIPETVRVSGPAGTIEMRNNVIVPLRHLHISAEQAAKHQLKDMDVVSIEVDGIRSVVFHNVIIRCRDGIDSLSFMVDTDEANAAGITSGALGNVAFSSHG